ncbi:HEPN domain-containing protein [Quisquiliibacterium transsilvanicum]|uniref:RiboL-PSP-HEPN domain-containing protein n=1 Tax=Quisquiliibacterium transsilvanicum TaxID=1549638 RepID=A0A7W8M7Z9_9BURK|nr:HEPN domain-containing protein [Quisquiliibacterium transsilvanicum]MBB5271303.1 hypothetical protein [Quisquiliibacterium transsilvanicum]
MVDKAPAEGAHNARARMLRQGLAVLVFSTVETFIRERTGEVLRSFTNPALVFADLPLPLQKAVTLDALEGVRFRLKLQPAANRIAWIVAKLAPISGAMTNVQGLSDHSFGHSASNIGEDDVKAILRSFGVDTPWAQITSLTARFGIATLDAEAEFKSIKERRHSSAHALTGQVLYADLQNSVKSSLAICLAFDLLLSHSGGLLNARAGPGQGGRALLTHLDFEIVFVASRSGATGFAVKREQLPPPAPLLKSTTVKTFSTENLAIEFGEQYANGRKRPLVVLDATSIPAKWVTWQPKRFMHRTAAPQTED